MDCSILFGTTCATRIIFATLAYLGFRGFENVDCAGVPEATSEVGMAQQQLPPIHPMMSGEEFCSSCEESSPETVGVLQRDIEPVIQGIGEINENMPTPGLVPSSKSQESSAVKELNYDNGMAFIMDIFQNHLSRSDRAICCLKYFLRRIADANTTKLKNSLRREPIPTGEKDTGDIVNDSSVKTLEGAETVNIAGKQGEGKKLESTGTDFVSWAKRMLESTKDHILGSDKNPDEPIPSIKQRMNNVGSAVAKAVCRKLTSAITKMANLLGVNDELYTRIRSIFVCLLYPPQGANDNNEQQLVSSLDEGCFQEKAKLLNAFYKNEVPVCMPMELEGVSEESYFGAPPFVSDVDTSTKFDLSQVYRPKTGDHVLGVVVAKTFDFYTLDIGGLCEALLPAVDGFRGATKRNRPNLNEGDLVFCQVTREYPRNELPTEVSCLDVDDMKHWTTKETYFGPLEDGFMFTVPIPYSYW
ncbi:exosome complex component RRP40 [Babesia ovis]|uniref:Exosome complex component RRP40 n=1 Tax=Babesia ovis TaxID=5869 RepID=A0A9W5T973_BABOV|nr:exosome complex component RRP40 [Babesia ovis]